MFEYGIHTITYIWT